MFVMITKIKKLLHKCDYKFVHATNGSRKGDRHYYRKCQKCGRVQITVNYTKNWITTVEGEHE